MKNKKTGVQEWAQHSLNLQYTCEYGCRYCYARKLNKRFKFQPKEPVIKKYNGVIMFPTMHDITVHNFDKVADTIEKLLEYDNKILIVSKMNRYVAIRFVERFANNPKKINLEFRITLTIFYNNYFEPNAPTYIERYAAIDYICPHFNFSISLEPLLNISSLIYIYLTYIGKSNYKGIWIGCLTNYKLNPKISEEKFVIDLYKNLPEIYAEWKKVLKFKDSFFKAMNRELKRRLKNEK